MGSHFKKRARQHGITETDLDLLWEEIKIAHQDGWGDFLEKVMDVKEGAALYRFKVSEGEFYAIITRGGRAKTVYPQEYLRNLRKRRKFQKKNRSRRRKMKGSRKRRA